MSADGVDGTIENPAHPNPYIQKTLHLPLNKSAQLVAAAPEAGPIE
jgi:hypothetical protein